MLGMELFLEHATETIPETRNVAVFPFLAAKVGTVDSVFGYAKVVFQ